MKMYFEPWINNLFAPGINMICIWIHFLCKGIWSAGHWTYGRYEQTLSLSLFWVLSYSHGAFYHCPLLTACSQFKQKHLMILIRIRNCPRMGEKAQCGVFQYAVVFCVSILAVINNKKHGLHNQSNQLSCMWTILIVGPFVQMNTER